MKSSWWKKCGVVILSILMLISFTDFSVYTAYAYDDPVLEEADDNAAYEDQPIDEEPPAEGGDCTALVDVGDGGGNDIADPPADDVTSDPPAEDAAGETDPPADAAGEIDPAGDADQGDGDGTTTTIEIEVGDVTIGDVTVNDNLEKEKEDATEDVAEDEAMDRGDREAEYTYQVDYPAENTAASGKTYNWFNPDYVAFYIFDGQTAITDEDILNQYELRITSIVSSDPGFTWDGTSTTILLADEDGVVYVATFALYEKESNQVVAGPYEMTVKTYDTTEVKDLLDFDDQYVTVGRVFDYQDGTEPFDGDHDPGNDDSPKNDYVRSFDYLSYNLSVQTAGYSGDYYKQGYIGFLILLAYADGTPIAANDVQFTNDSLTWMTTGNSVSELNATINGTKTFTVNGTSAEYVYAKGYHYLNSLEESSFPALDTVSFEYKIGGIADGKVIKPMIWAWVYPNDVDLDTLYTDYSNASYYSCDDHLDEPNVGKELVPIETREVTVSAAPHYNVQIKDGGGSFNEGSFLDYFDFSTGNETGPDYSNHEYRRAVNYGIGTYEGRIHGLGITLQLYNNNTSKGLKGIEIPKGPITFSIELKGKFSHSSSEEYDMDYSGAEAAFTPQLWSYQELGSVQDQHRYDGRKVFIYYNNNYGWPYYWAPSNSRRDHPYSNSVLDSAGNITTCYNGGTWSVSQTGSTLTFTVKDYAFSPEWFPNGDSPVASVNGFPYWNPANGIDKCYIGCFSSCDIWIMVPVKDKDGNSITDHTTTDDQGNEVTYGAGNIKVDVNDVSLSATSISDKPFTDPVGTNDAQQNQEDDHRTLLCRVDEPSGPGTFSKRIWYSDNTNHLNRDTSGTDLCDSNGCDVAEVGQKIGAIWRTAYRGRREEFPVAINALLKFDDAAMATYNVYEIEDRAKYYDTSFLYAAKKDGTGWNHFGLQPGDTGYDAEMDAAIEGQLVYFSTLSDLENAGYVCVGILAESRYTEEPIRFNNNSTLSYKTYFQLDNNNEMMGNVYQICWSLTTWSHEDLDGALGTTVPSRLEVQGNRATFPEASRQDERTGYTKSTYGADGNWSGGHLAENGDDAVYHGDSVYIIPYRPEVTKAVAQNNSDGTTKTQYQLDAAQNIADYIITVKTKKLINNPVEGYSPTTTVYMEDVIPAGLTYRDDAVLGGTYEQSSTPGYHGTVTGGVTDGGRLEYTTQSGATGEMEFHVNPVSNADGSTTLGFTILNFPVSQDVYPIYYSVDIDRNAENNKNFKNTVKVWTDDVVGPFGVSQGTVAEAGITVVRNSSISLNKLTEKKFVDVSEIIGYNMTWLNTGKNNFLNHPMIDVLPWIGDEYHTDFGGTYTLDSITLTNNNGTTTTPITDFTGLEVWYTTDEYVRGADLSEIGDDGIRNDSRWQQAAIVDDGTVSGFDPDSTAFCILGPLKAGKTVQATCTIRPSGNFPGDKYANTIYVAGLVADALEVVLNREVSGLVWYDANNDGARQTTEKTVAGVNVRLVKKDDYEAFSGSKAGSSRAALPDPVTNLKGEVCASMTGVDGKYKFSSLPAGDFVIMFTDGDTELNDFGISPFEVENVNEINNCNASGVLNADDELEYGVIQGITMPAASDIVSSPYSVRYEDMGLTGTTSLYVKKAWMNLDGTNDAPEDAEVTFTLYADGEEAGFEVTLTGTPGPDPDVAAAYESAEWVGAFVNLPQYYIDGEGHAQEIEYTVQETGTWPGYTVSYEGGESVTYTVDGGTITNSEVPTGLSVIKAWKNSDGSTTPPDGAEVTFTLYADGEPAGYSVTLDGEEDSDPIMQGGQESAPWKASFVRLPKYKVVDGEAVEIEYTVVETGTWPGYTVIYEGGEEVTYALDHETITNEQENTSLKVRKAWLNADGSTTPPEDSVVTFTLVADGEPTNVKVTLEGTSNEAPSNDMCGFEPTPWEAQYISLPKYKIVDGEKVEIQYTVQETGTWPGYTVTYEGGETATYAEDGGIITNTQTTTELTVKKAWLNADGTTEPPANAEVKFTLYADGEATDFSVPLDGIADPAPGHDVTTGYEVTPWVATFVNLPKYKAVDGKEVEIEYTVKETGTWAGYTVSYEGGQSVTYAVDGQYITNTEETTELIVKKAWLNADGTTTPPEDGKVTFTLYADGVITDYTVTLDGTAEDEIPVVTGTLEIKPWTGAFVNLPKYKNSHNQLTAIEYTVVETGLWPGYTVVYEGGEEETHANPGETITNKQDVTSLEVKKLWNNLDGTNEGPDGAEVTFTLFADGENTGLTATLDGTADEQVPTVAGGYESSQWIGKFVNIPKYKIVNGKEVEIEYTVMETGTWPGYTVSYEGGETVDYAVPGGYITNTQTPTSLSVIKAWQNADGSTTAPEDAEVTFTLYADGEDTGITVTLDGTAENEVPTVTGGYESEAWKATFVNLPKYKVVEGKAVEIQYTVKETGTWAGYEVIYEGEDAVSAIADGVITNVQKMTELSVTKAWLNADGTATAPDGAEVTFALYADGEDTGVTVTLDGTIETEAPIVTGGYESAAWTAKFVKLPKYKAVDGEEVEIEYTVQETGTWPGYTVSYGDGTTATYAVDGGIITNTQVTTVVGVKKYWIDVNGNYEEPTDREVTFTLYADGQTTGLTATVDGTADAKPTGTAGYEASPWIGEFINLPKYKIVDGKEVEIQYTVKETGTWPGYTVTYDGGEEVDYALSGEYITNTQVPTELSVIKAWLNADGTTTAPEDAEVTFTLYADGEATNYTVTLDGETDTAVTTTGGYESEAWKATFIKLPKYKVVDGKEVEIEYTVQETGEWPGYEVVYEGGETATYAVADETITNKQITTELSGIKTWNDADFFVDGVPVDGYQRPESITINLLADGEVVDSKTVTEDDDWEYEFTDLPKYRIENGQAVEIVYTIEEEVVAGYTGVVTGTDVDNTPVKDEQVAPTEIILKKVDALTMGGLAGAEFTLTYPDGNDKPLTVKEDGTLTIEFTVEGTYTLVETKAPDGYQNPGTEYTITVEKVFQNVALVDNENAPGGKLWMWYYQLEASVDQDYDADTNTITVKDPPELIDIEGEKIWDDGNDADKKRPKSITVELYADGEKIDEQEVTSANNWKFTFTDLPKMKDGKEIVYTIGEVKVEGYTTTIEGFKITNYHKPAVKTGDEMELNLWLSMLCASVLALAAMLVRIIALRCQKR